MNSTRKKSLKNRLICFSFLLYSIFPCNGSGSSSDWNYKQNITRIKSEFLQIDELIGRPYDIVCKDNLLIYTDFYDGLFLSVFNLKNNRFVGRFLQQGQGPNDAIALIYLLPYPEKDKLYIYQRNAAKLSILDTQKFNIQRNIQFTSKTAWRPFEMQRTKDFFIGTGILEKGRFAVYDLNGTFITEGGRYPFRGERMERANAFLTYQGSYCTNPDNNSFASGCLYSDYLAFYKVKDNEITLTKEYFSRDADIKSDNNGTTSRVAPNNSSTINYTSAFGSKSYCYMLFSGKTYEDNNNSDSGGKHIIIFDWDGNYIKTFETDVIIYNFFVDETNNIIFAVANDESGEKAIVKFEIPIL